MPDSYLGLEYRVEAALAILGNKMPHPDSQAAKCIRAFAAELRRQQGTLNRGLLDA